MLDTAVKCSTSASRSSRPRKLSHGDAFVTIRRLSRQNPLVATHLVILNERKAIAWVLTTRQMAFPPLGAEPAAAAIKANDCLLLYSTRGAFHNPTKHRGPVFGSAIAASDVVRLTNGIVVAGRLFAAACALQLHKLATCGSGADLAELVPQLESFPNKRAWAIRLRRPYLTLTTADADLIETELARHATSDTESAISTYVRAARGGRKAVSR